MATLQDVVGHKGIFTDGDWILSENMDANGKYGVIQLKHVGVGEFLLQKDFNFISERTFHNLSCTEVLCGDILISRMADPIGRACIVPKLQFPCITAVDVTIVRVDKSVAYVNYIMHLCNSSLMRKQIDRAVRGTTRARITRTELGQLEIPLPPLPEQQRIAAILSKADRLRRLRRTARQLGETYLQSVFVEMFHRNTGSSWPKFTVADLVQKGKNKIRTGPFGSQLLHSEFHEEGDVAVLGIDNAVQNRFAWGKHRYITFEKYRQLTRYTVHPGDVIITIMATTGRCAVVPDNIPLAINTKHLCCITLDQEKCLPQYLHASFLFDPFVVRQMGGSERGAIMPGLNMSIINDLHVTVPPLYLQQRFAAIVQRYERLRLQQREAERQAEMLFQGLLRGAFEGEG